MYNLLMGLTILLWVWGLENLFLDPSPNKIPNVVAECVAYAGTWIAEMCRD